MISGCVSLTRQRKSGVLCFAAASIFAAFAAAGDPQPSDPGKTGGVSVQLRRGEVPVRVLPGQPPSPDMIQASILIGAPSEKIWAIMTDCGRAIRFVPGLKACRVLESLETEEIIEHRVRYFKLLPEVVYTFLTRYDPPREIRFQFLSGDLKEFRGSWLLRPLDEGRKTVVTYSVYIDPGFFLPQWVIRYLLRRDLPGLLTALRDEVQASGP
jgi:ribosome-associated toxin RatA of RatAB toxin-antitoxin module